MRTIQGSCPIITGGRVRIMSVYTQFDDMHAGYAFSETFGKPGLYLKCQDHGYSQYIAYMDHGFTKENTACIFCKGKLIRDEHIQALNNLVKVYAKEDVFKNYLNNWSYTYSNK